MTDIDIARQAAAEVDKRGSYLLGERMYLSGACDDDDDVQAALLAIQMVRRIKGDSA